MKFLLDSSRVSWYGGAMTRTDVIKYRRTTTRHSVTETRLPSDPIERVFEDLDHADRLDIRRPLPMTNN